MTQQNHGRGAGRNRLELCLELVNQAMKCLSNGDRECVVRLIEELVRANCHDGRLIGKEVMGKVKEVVHELWLKSDDGFRCGLLRMIKDLGISKRWVKDALHKNNKALNTWFVRCGIDWESRIVRGNAVKVIEGLLRERFGWSETKMCEELFKFIGIDVNEFRRHGIEPCTWFNGLEKLSDLKRPYWLGLRTSDLVVKRCREGIELILSTTNSVDAVFFLKILSTVKTPSLTIERLKKRTLPMKYVSETIILSYYIDLGINAWPWPIELSANRLERMIKNFSDEELAEYIAGIIDGDGSVQYIFEDNNAYVYVEIVACEECHKSYILNMLRNVIAEKFGIVGNIESRRAASVLMFSGEKAVKLLRHIAKYMHHPLRRLRAELILAYYDGKISREELTKLYKPTKYRRRGPDVKRNNALEVAIQAAPQTHTHGVCGMGLTWPG